MSRAPLPEDPRAAARLAAEARLRQPPPNPHSDSSTSHSPSAPFNPSAADKLGFHRLLDSELLPKTSKTQAVKTLTILQTITGNILTPPNPAQAAKYRQIRLANAGIKKNVVDVPGAYDYLVQAGFRSSTVNFEAFLTFPPAPLPTTLHKLRVANLVLSIQLARSTEAEEREKRFRTSEKEAEAQRVQKAMLGFEEDRRLKKERDDREKIVRAARLANPTPASPPAASTSSRRGPTTLSGNTPSGLPGSFFSGPTDAASTMRVDIDDDDEDEGAEMGMGESGDEEEEELPPSYGQLHGRVLGTGLPPGFEVDQVPAGVRMAPAGED